MSQQAMNAEERTLEARATEERTQDAYATFLNEISLKDVDRRQGHYLPVWTTEGAIYHVRFRLIDSIPYGIRKELLREKEQLLALVGKPNTGMTQQERKRLLRFYTEKVDRLLDAGHGACWLANEAIAELVGNSLRFFDGQRYVLYSWCVMPNHVHAIVRPLPGHELTKILHSWKSFTANKANKLLERSGAFWQRDSFNRIIRSPEDLSSRTDYVFKNPDHAGLQNWKWRGP